MKNLLLVNPSSGRFSWKIIKKVSDKIEYFRIYVTHKLGDAEEFVSTLNYDDEEDIRIIVMGGDGTIHEVVNGLYLNPNSDKFIVSVIPTGTGNNLAADLGMMSIEDGIERLTSTDEMIIDVVKVTSANATRISVNTIASGIFAKINKTATKLSSKWPKFMKNNVGMRYNLATFWCLFKIKFHDSQIKVDDHEITNGFSGFLGQTTKRCGNGIIVAPYKTLTNGNTHLVYTDEDSKFKAFWLFLKSKMHGKLKDFTEHETNSWTIDGEGYCTLDGQDEQIYFPAKFETLYKFYRVI